MKVLEKKIEALAKFLKVNEDEIEVDGSGMFIVDNEEYYSIYTNEEREQAVRDYIRDNVWAFKASFILNHTGIHWNDRIARALERMQEKLCEDANELILAMIKDFDEFVEDAVEADGYGHFLSSWDGEEHECDGFYIYRN